MVKLFFILSCILSILLVAGIIYLFGNKHDMSRWIRHLFAAAAVTTMCNALAIIIPDKTFSTLLHGLYFAATDWLVLSLFMYTKNYTGLCKNEKVISILLCAGSAVDTVSMILNPYFHHVFECTETEILNSSSCYIPVPNISIYIIHLIYVYSSVIIVVSVLVVKTRKTIKLYRKKYEMVLISFICILAANIGYRFIKALPIDMSPVLYILLAVSIGYFTLFYVPKGIVAKLLSFSIEDMDSGIICLDMYGKCVYANTAARRQFNADNDLHKIEKLFSKWKTEQGDGELKEFSWRRTHEAGDRKIHYEARFKPLFDDNGNYIGCFFHIEDVTDKVMQLDKERFKATHDALTGIYNRERFFEAVRSLLDKSPDIERYMVCCDIKDFKMINEMFGEKTGDQILIKIASILGREASSESIYGRLGSDKFALCIRRDTFNEDKLIRYSGVLSDMAKNNVYHLHLHIGVYSIDDPSLEISVMCDRALTAISRIKDNYQQIITYYDNKLGEIIQNEKTLIGEFDKAIESGQFCIHLQPQISVDNKLIGAEALVRWVHPERGMISPGEFIPLFEKSGYIHRLDRYVWELACRQLRKWKEQGHDDLHISVNISPKDFYYINIYDTFVELVEKYGINPVNLKLEITETALMTELNQQMKLLDRLRDYGFHIEIDDFGSGYSSLNMLKDIQVDVLKLDMGFLRKTGQEEKGRTIMNSIISMSKQLGLIVVTEGVETVEQVDYLTKAGCDIFQGFYFAKPMPADEFEQKLSQSQ